MRKILFIANGQSNWQGAAFWEGGGTQNRYRSQYTGAVDPLPGCNNWQQGGSCFPYLVDLARSRGVDLDVVNHAIGGASVFHYSGITGATVTGGVATLPAQQGYMSPLDLSGGSGAASEGGAGFDPFGLLARSRALITQRASVPYDAIICYWCNGESDAGVGAEAYANGLTSIAEYMVASGVDRHVIGLSSKQDAASTVDFDALKAGVEQAVQALQAAGKPVFLGHSMWDYYRTAPPLYPETNGAYVHMTLRGQYAQAILVDAVLQSLGI